MVSHIYNCFALDKTLPLLKHSLFIQINMVSLHHILLLFFFKKINFTPCFKNDKGINSLYNAYFFVSEDLYTLKYFKSFFQLIKKIRFCANYLNISNATGLYGSKYLMKYSKSFIIFYLLSHVTST